MHLYRVFFLLVLLLIAVPAEAQTDLTCRQIADRALELAVPNCAELDTGMICYGHAVLRTTFTTEESLTESGEQAALDMLLSLQSGAFNHDAETWGLARLRIAANLTGDDSVLLVSFGDVLLENEVSLPTGPRIDVTAPSGMNLRAEPSTESAIVGGLTAGQTVTVNARNADATWLHVTEPAGWVFAELVNSEADVNDLTVTTDPAVLSQTPWQTLSLRSGAGEVDCPAYDNNGLLLQAPLDGDPALMVVNDAELAFNGIVYLQAVDNLIVQALEGTALVAAHEGSQQLIAGTQVLVPLNASGTVADAPGELQAYVEDTIETLPLALLDREFEIAPALADDVLAALASCSVTASANVNLRSGPGTAYPTIGRLEAENSQNVRGQATGTDEFIWWQLIDESWVRSDVVTAADGCAGVLVVEDIPEPPVAPAVTGRATVIYRMENCIVESGSLAAGEVIGFAYSGGSWPSRDEARQALSELTGSVTVDGEPLAISLGTLQWGENNYGVTIQGNWTATAGNYTVNARMSLFGGLTANCTVTVG